jgi:hypothetical protein
MPDRLMFPSEHVMGFSEDINPTSVTGSEDPFHKQEWFNPARDDVLRKRRTPPLVSFVIGWLFGWALQVCCLCCDSV